MLFDRRHKPAFRHRAREFIWPRAGWRRTTRYIIHRVRRIPGSPYAIAAGFACGAAISMTPFPGFHFILSGLLAWSLRASILASAIGTVVGNPWTFPFIWLWIFQLGSWLVGGPQEFSHQQVTLGYLLEHPMQILLPMLVGSIPTALVTWFVFYWPLKRMVHGYQTHRRHRLERAASQNRLPRAMPAEEGE